MAGDRAGITGGVLGIRWCGFGRAEFTDLLSIDLNASSVVGGVWVAGMGFEMLYGGVPSKTQGQDRATTGQTKIVAL